jgi:hypothetical protein
MMRKTIFFIFTFSALNIQGSEIIEGNFIRKRLYFFSLDLPYNVKDNVEYIFDEDTPYAIDIIELRADGKELHYNNEFEAGSSNSRRFFRIKKTIDGENEYFITMYWLVVPPFPSMALLWNDGRDIMLWTSNGPQENTYVITNEMKILEITYRIVLPYPTLTIDNLYDMDYEYKIFTEEYHMIVNLNGIFPILEEIK